ncbi:MAG: HI0074 family nucleotidyltransferase substrate-binding subunit [Melioribacteraceae bacterium]|nr:HI0074 family nucleotidyltransferase substrate-binding subunit [Melioribacteraceae bacterium]
MEEKEKYKLKLKTLNNAIKGFSSLMEKDITLFDEVISDGLMNGRIQKFEYCSELLWKTAKKFLWIYDGIDAKSPKSTMKELFLANYIAEEEYEVLFEMINDRNRLSHIYKEGYFLEIHKKLINYLIIMKKLKNVISESN